MDRTLTDLERMQLWAADRKCYVEMDGSVGFGRPCVGLIQGDHYVGYGEHCGSSREVEVIFEENAPNGAYHKDSYMAVLVGGSYGVLSYGEAIDKLVQWWKDTCLEHRLTVTVEETRPDNVIELIFHGTSRAFFAKETK